jgi:hypothetical protein
LLGNGAAGASPRQRRRHAIIEELLEAVFSVRSVPKLYNKELLPYESVWRRQLVSELQLKRAGQSRIYSEVGVGSRYQAT